MEDVCSNGHLSAKSYDLEISGAFRDTTHYHRESFPAETSIGDLKLKVLTIFAESYGIVNNFLRLADPELLVAVVFEPTATGFPLQYCTDDTQTLRDYLRQVGYFDSCAATFADPFPIKLRLVPECTWFEFAKAYQKAKKYREESARDDYEYRTRHHDYYSSDSNSDSDTELNSEDLFCRERPHEKLEENRGVLEVLGRLHVETRQEDGSIKRRRVAELGGLKCDLKDVVKITTTAKHVLVVFTSFNIRMACAYHSLLDDRDIHNDPSDNILAILLTWDKFSYLLLRKLRKNLDPNVPIIAITESNLHELDLLAFLDTPPSQVDSIYAWGLSQDCAALGLMDVDVDIKWAGLWPSETLNPTYAPNTRPVDISSPEYNKICDFLKGHPRLKEKPKWLEELALFIERPEYLYLYFIGVDGNDFASYCEDVFFPNKLANKDWI